MSQATWLAGLLLVVPTLATFVEEMEEVEDMEEMEDMEADGSTVSYRSCQTNILKGRLGESKQLYQVFLSCYHFVHFLLVVVLCHLDTRQWMH